METNVPRRSVVETERARAGAVERVSAQADQFPPMICGPPTVRRRLAIIFTVSGLLTLHYVLAAHSLLQENPTVDEVMHLPAGVTYWQKRTFRLYHHNPPLVKLVAALPVVMAKPRTDGLYEMRSWKAPDPAAATFARTFAIANVRRYFELFQLARLVMPLFSMVGGLAVFAWSRRLYGVRGGLLSLSLWVFCPNILAHARLVTSDLGSTALGVAATYVFWRYLHQPAWRLAAAAGIMLGLAQLTKFTMILLYVVWPFQAVIWLFLVTPRPERLDQIPRALGHGLLILILSIAVIDAGYLFEGVGTPLGRFEFGSRTLTRPATPGMKRPRSKNDILDVTWQFRVNRFRGTWLENVPCPLPEHYMLGFDEQRIDTERIPERMWKAVASNRVAEALAEPEPADEEKTGYTVYLNGELRKTGWWYYYLLALAYKVPEGTLLLVGISIALIGFVSRSRQQLADEIALWTPPVVILFSMSFLTDINLGLRYVLAIMPYLFISAGKLLPWAAGLGGARQKVVGTLVAGSLGATVAAAFLIHPHYLAYFNWVSGGPDRVPPRLIDSNLDWGQDLVALQQWCKKTIPGQPIGLAYFGLINPSIFRLRGESFDWFLPPVPPDAIRPLPESPSPMLVGPARRLTPGYYAVSASLVYGLRWRLYDSAPPTRVPGAWAPAWNVIEDDVFGYFRRFKPVERIGHSIYLYHLTADDIARAGDSGGHGPRP